jgi:uncharacterized membrane protein YdjX (TVP38/TMEM64 family)
MKKPLKITAFVLLGLLIIALCIVFINVDASDILRYTPETPWLAAIVLLGLFCLKSVVIVMPLNVLFISAGIMFPLGWALAIILTGMLLEMTIGYFNGKRLKIDKVMTLAARFAKLSQFLPNNAKMTPAVCFSTRFLPLPFDLICMVHGAYGVKFPQYVLITYLGTLLAMIPYIFIGIYITTPFSKEFLIPLAVIALVALFPFALHKSRTKKTATDTE